MLQQREKFSCVQAHNPEHHISAATVYFLRPSHMTLASFCKSPATCDFFSLSPLAHLTHGIQIHMSHCEWPGTVPRHSQPNAVTKRFFRFRSRRKPVPLSLLLSRPRLSQPPRSQKVSLRLARRPRDTRQPQGAIGCYDSTKRLHSWSHIGPDQMLCALTSCSGPSAASRTVNTMWEPW